MSAPAVSGGSSPQRETTIAERPINGDSENAPLSDSSVTPTETTKVVPPQAVHPQAPQAVPPQAVPSSPQSNSGVSSAASEPPHHPPPTNAVPGNPSGGVVSPSDGDSEGPGSNIPPSRAHQTNPPLMNRGGGIVSMSRMGGGGGGGGGGHSPGQGGWNSYQSRPPPNRYNEMSPAQGYGNYQNRQYNSQQGGGDSLSKTNLYIRGLMPNTTDHDLHSLCQGYGSIKSTKAIVDQVTNKCKGYGFVDFERPTDAERAVQILQQNGIQAQMAKVRESSTQDQDPTNLYIANLPDFVDESYLESMVRGYGSVVSVRILRDNAGKSRNVGFCRMDSKEICERIVHDLNKKPLSVGQEPLLVKFADSGHRRKREYRNMHTLLGYDTTLQHGPMGGQMMTQSMNARYSMQPVTNQSNYLPAAAAAGSWPGMPMYPQVAMSPVNPVTSMQSNIMDPATTLLASQLGQMQIAPQAQSYGMQQSQQAYTPMYQGQGMIPPQFQYDVSASPPNHMGHAGIEEHNYPNFG